MQTHIERVFMQPGSVTGVGRDADEGFCGGFCGFRVPDLVPALPYGLRHLHLDSDGKNVPLRPGSMPSSVRFLRFSRHWRFSVDRPCVLEPHVLPEGLAHVIFDPGPCAYRVPLLFRHSLPASLRQLRWGCPVGEL